MAANRPDNLHIPWFLIPKIAVFRLLPVIDPSLLSHSKSSSIFVATAHCGCVCVSGYVAAQSATKARRHLFSSMLPSDFCGSLGGRIIWLTRNRRSAVLGVEKRTIFFI